MGFCRLFRFSPFAPETARRVGVLCVGAIGDLLLATNLFSGLRHALPEADIEVITSKANASAHILLPSSCRSVAFPITDMGGMVRHVRSARFDILIDIGQWARISALICAFSGAKYTVGFATPGQYRHYVYDRTTSHQNDRHETDNFFAMGQTLFPKLQGSPEIIIPEKPSEMCPVLPGKNIVFCHMWPSGVNSFLKEWPGEYWETLASTLLEAGYVPVFTGGGDDAEATDGFVAQVNLKTKPCEARAISVAGKISLADLAYHMRRAAAVVSVNTGTMHLAALSGAATVGLHGPTNPLRWGPVGERICSLLPDKGRSAYLDLGFEYPDGVENVMQYLPVSSVVTALRNFGLRL